MYASWKREGAVAQCYARTALRRNAYVVVALCECRENERGGVTTYTFDIICALHLTATVVVRYGTRVQIMSEFGAYRTRKISRERDFTETDLACMVNGQSCT
jgi:hypothetical protein